MNVLHFKRKWIQASITRSYIIQQKFVHPITSVIFKSTRYHITMNVRRLVLLVRVSRSALVSYHISKNQFSKPWRDTVSANKISARQLLPHALPERSCK